MISPDCVYHCRDSAFPKGPYVEEGNTAVAYTTPEEREAAARWSLWINSAYVPAVYREYYGVPEVVYVYSVVTHSPAGDAGLQEGDIMISLGDVLTNCDESLAAATGRIAKGDTVDALYWRGEVFYLTKVTR